MAEAEAITSSVAAVQDVPKPPARRGRPRRKGGPSRTVVPTLLSPISRTDSTQAPSAHDPTDVRPREERSYKEFFPDLDLSKPLPIVRTRQRDNDALTASDTTDFTPTTSQKEKNATEHSEVSVESPQAIVPGSQSNGSVTNGTKSPKINMDASGSGMLGALSRTLALARNHLKKKENGSIALKEASPDFEESDLSSVSDTAATSSEDATSSPKSIMKHGQQEKSNMESQAGDSNPFQALSTRPIHPSQDISGPNAAVSEQQVTLNLPKRSFWKVQEPMARKPKAEQLQSDSDSSDEEEAFKRPDNHYIRYIGTTRTIKICSP